jgi:hypothetical protein
LVWWQGKKTIIGGGLIVAAAAAAIWFGKIDATTGAMIAGAGLSIAGFAAKANRHHAELLIGLQAIAEAGADARAGKQAAAVEDIESAARRLAVKQWGAQSNGNSDPEGDAK